MLIVDITREAPENFIALAWDTFFASRGRGISRAVNMPWLDDGRTYFVTMRNDSEVYGGLAVRPVESNPGYLAALIGMVCVRPDQRGKGLSKMAVMAAIEEARRLGTDDLFLWTGKPQVYAGLGFILDDSAASGTVCGAVTPRDTPPPMRTAWPMPGALSRGLPPYAKAGWHWSTPEASALVIEDPRGPILCEWSGHDVQVAELLAHAMPKEWRMHSLNGDTLPDELARRGWAVDLTPSRSQMSLQLSQRHYTNSPVRLRLLDRI
jgi:GNAT superfamily N-acetyltransferase